MRAKTSWTQGFAGSVQTEVASIVRGTAGTEGFADRLLAKRWKEHVLVRVLSDLGRLLNPTMVTITHDLRVAFSIGERVALLSDGKIVADLPPRHFEASVDPRVAAFVRGDSVPQEAAA